MRLRVTSDSKCIWLRALKSPYSSACRVDSNTQKTRYFTLASQKVFGDLGFFVVFFLKFYNYVFATSLLSCLIALDFLRSFIESRAAYYLVKFPLLRCLMFKCFLLFLFFLGVVANGNIETCFDKVRNITAILSLKNVSKMQFLKSFFLKKSEIRRRTLL